MSLMKITTDVGTTFGILIGETFSVDITPETDITIPLDKRTTDMVGDFTLKLPVVFDVVAKDSEQPVSHLAIQTYDREKVVIHGDARALEQSAGCSFELGETCLTENNMYLNESQCKSNYERSIPGIDSVHFEYQLPKENETLGTASFALFGEDGSSLNTSCLANELRIKSFGITTELSFVSSEPEVQ